MCAFYKQSPLTHRSPRDAEGRIATNCPGLNFCTGYQQQVTVFPKDNWQAELPIASGTIQLSSRLYVDWDEINMDPAHHH